MTATADLVSAYARQDRLVAAALDAGGRLAGHKLGLTSAAGREAFGASEPVRGSVFAAGLVADGGTARAAAFTDLLVEPEVAVIVGEVPPAGAPPAAWIAGIAPALEIVDNTLGAGPPALADLIASNVVAHGAVVGAAAFGPPEAVLAGASCRFGIEGGAEQTVPVDASDPAPLEAFAWLLEELVARGETPAPGQFVLTGALGTPCRPVAGDVVTADFGPLGLVSLRLL